MSGLLCLFDLNVVGVYGLVLNAFVECWLLVWFGGCLFDDLCWYCLIVRCFCWCLL